MGNEREEKIMPADEILSYKEETRSIQDWMIGNSVVVTENREGLAQHGVIRTGLKRHRRVRERET